MTEKPKTWTDEEIVEIMVKEARAYKTDLVTGHAPGTFSYKDMMECVLMVLKKHGLIEDTP